MYNAVKTQEKSNKKPTLSFLSVTVVGSGGETKSFFMRIMVFVMIGSVPKNGVLQTINSSTSNDSSS